MSGSVVLVAAGPSSSPQTLPRRLRGLLREVMSLEGARHLNTEAGGSDPRRSWPARGDVSGAVSSLREEGFSEVIWTPAADCSTVRSWRAAPIDSSCRWLRHRFAPDWRRSLVPLSSGPSAAGAGHEPGPAAGSLPRLSAQRSRRGTGLPSRGAQSGGCAGDQVLPEVVEGCLRRSLAGPSELQDRLRELLRSLD